MCYDIKTSLESQLRRAEFLSDKQAIAELKEKLQPFLNDNTYHASGYAHPKMLIYPDRSPTLPEISLWGLIPFWVKDKAKRNQLWNSTLNARGETIFEKPSFRDSAKHKRCLIVLDAFYEHHHHAGKAYPFLIQKKDKKPITVAGLWSEWLDRDTGELINSFSIVTTRANRLLTRIHNNPKLTEPRMPLILSEEEIEQWLAPVKTDTDISRLKKLIKPYRDEELVAHTVRRLRGKNALGNIPESAERFSYEELSALEQALEEL